MTTAATLPDQLPPVGSLQNVLKEALSAAGIPTPECEAALLLEEVLDCRRNDLFLKRGARLDERQEERLRTWFRRRVEERVPLQYLFGHASFYNLELTVTPDVLIPRPETEVLVDFLLAALPPSSRLLDLGTGSGAIPLAVTAERGDVTALGVDVSSAALAVARRNAAALGLSARAAFRHSDLCSELAVSECFDAVAANLPYVTEEEYAQLDPEVRCHEPKLALTAAQRGMALIWQSVREIPAHLVIGGRAIWELSPFQAPLLAAELSRDGRWGEIGIRRDLTGRDRFVAARFEGAPAPR